MYLLYYSLLNSFLAFIYRYLLSTASSSFSKSGFVKKSSIPAAIQDSYTVSPVSYTHPDVYKRQMLTRAGIKIIKFYFSVSKEEQAARFQERRTNPLKQYKLSPIDQFSQKLWDRYTLAEYLNFSQTHSEHAPWTIVKSDNKEVSRINAIKYLLSQFDLSLIHI